MKRTLEIVATDDAFFDTMPPELFEMIIKLFDPLDFYSFSLTNAMIHESMKTYKRPCSVIFMARSHSCGNRNYGRHNCSQPWCSMLRNICFTNVSIPIVSIIRPVRIDEDRYIEFRIRDPECPFWERGREKEKYDLFTMRSDGEVYYINEEEEYMEHAYAFTCAKIVWQ